MEGQQQRLAEHLSSCVGTGHVMNFLTAELVKPSVVRNVRAENVGRTWR